MPKLYQLTETYNALEDLLDSEPEDLSQESIMTALAAVQGEIRTKVASIGKIILGLKSDATAIEAEEDRLAKKRQTCLSKIEWLKSYLLQEMVATNTKSVKEPTISVAVQDNPVSIELIDLSQVPEIFTRTIPEYKELNKKLALCHLAQTGEEIPGIRVINDRKHLVIR